MNVNREIEAIIGKAKERGEYIKQSIPSSMLQMDEDINTFIEKAFHPFEKKQEIMSFDVSPKIAWNLLGFAITMATYSIRKPNERVFRNGLRALKMILGVLDTRELLVVMPLYYNSSKEYSYCFDYFIEQEDEFGEFLKGFLNRNEEHRTLECMGYMLTTDENGNLFYKRTW